MTATPEQLDTDMSLDLRDVEKLTSYRMFGGQRKMQKAVKALRAAGYRATCRTLALWTDAPAAVATAFPGVVDTNKRAERAQAFWAAELSK